MGLLDFNFIKIPIRRKSAYTQPVKFKKMSESVIQLRKVVKKYKTPAGDFMALNGVDIDFFQGEFVGITGKSGSGKSTLINMITGIDKPNSGEVRIGDTFVQHLTESEMARWRGRNLGIVFQFYQLLPMLSLLENVMLPMDFSEMYNPAVREKRALELLRRVGLEKEYHKMPAEISGGQQQAAAIARALANDPPFLIADEPTGNLDSRTADQVFNLFAELSGQGKTILMITHDPHLANRTSRQILLSDGEIVNEWIRRALPMLPHTMMLKATHQIQQEQYEPGSMIIRQGLPNKSFYIVTKGRVDIALEKQVVAQLHPGEYFGEMELINSVPAVANVTAGQDSQTEVIALDQSTFTELLGHANVKDNIYSTMQERIAQDRNLRGRK